MKYARVMFAMSVLVGSVGWAQEKLPPREEDARPSLTVGEGKEAKPLTLKKADVRVVVAGFVAETTMTLTFHNDLSRVLEGELTFPLPQGATVSGYGLDVNGVMCDGVPVEKQQARIAFESEVRKGIDPGLVEHVKGNNFRTRVFPIPANGDRTIKVQYLSELNTAGGDVSYLLPTNWGDNAVSEYKLKVEVVAAGEPVIAGGPGELPLRKEGNRIIAVKTFTDIKLKKDLVISLPKPPEKMATVEKRIGDSGEEYFFTISDLPVAAIVKENLPQVNRFAIAWDGSLSRAESDHARELALIGGVVKRYPDVRVDVVVFRNRAEAPVTFEIKGGDASKLVEFLSKIQYDGGTNLADLKLGTHASPPTVQNNGLASGYSFWLLFTDGLGDLFGDAPGTVAAPVYTVSNDSRSNHDLLTHLSQSSGGQYFNLKRVGNEEAVKSIGATPFNFISAEFDEKQVGEIYPKGVRPVMGRFALAGKLLAAEAKIVLNYGYGTNVTHRSEYVLKREGATETGLAARSWAQQKVGELSVFAEKNHDAILGVGREFGLVTANTSLMVLESTEQYLQYGITPPKSRPDVYAAYMKQIDQRQQAKVKGEKEKTEQVAVMWQRRVEWWEKRFEVANGFKYVATPEKNGDAPRLRAVAGDAAPRPGERIVTRARRDPSAPVVHSPEPVSRLADDAASEGGRGGGAAAGGSYRGLASSATERSKTGGGAIATGPTISIKPWDPETPYLILLKQASPDKAYSVYLEQRKNFGTAPAFYLDCADFFLGQKQRDVAIRVLTNVAELQLENAPLFRVAGHRLMQIEEHDLAIDLFEKVARLRPEEPQSHRDLALALEARAMARKGSPSSSADYQRAAELLKKVVLGQWDGRFPEIEVIALEELNAMIAHAPEGAIKIDLDPRLKKNLDTDVRVVLTWDVDLTDIDLWVTEPSGEKCLYSHNRTTIGGLMSNDFTQGYGPEAYWLRKSMPGEYTIQCNFYGSRQQSLTGPTTIQATVITHFGRPNEKRQALTVRLAKQKDVVDLGTVKIE